MVKPLMMTYHTLIKQSTATKGYYASTVVTLPFKYEMAKQYTTMLNIM